MNIDIGLPWSLAPLKGKYYGTEILDCDGRFVMNVWKIPWTDAEGSQPSERELARWSKPEDFEVCDSHYECVASYFIAQTIVETINAHSHT